MWGREVVSHLTHNQEVGGSNPPPATMNALMISFMALLAAMILVDAIGRRIR